MSLYSRTGIYQRAFKPMNISDVGKTIIQYIAKYAAKKTTGQLTFHINLKDGGIGNCVLDVRISDSDFKKDLRN